MTYPVPGCQGTAVDEPPSRPRPPPVAQIGGPGGRFDRWSAFASVAPSRRKKTDDGNLATSSVSRERSSSAQRYARMPAVNVKMSKPTSLRSTSAKLAVTSIFSLIA